MNIQQARSYIQRRLQQELHPDLHYHGYHHTLDVVIAAMKLAKMENIAGEDLVLLETAAWFHDAGFINVYRNHEEEGVSIMRQALPDCGYNQEQIDKIASLIMATKIPQSPKNHLEQVLCDADLEYLGSCSYYAVAETLRRELDMKGFIASQKHWVEMQLKFLESHQYFTPSALRINKKEKEARIKELRKVYASFQ